MVESVTEDQEMANTVSIGDYFHAAHELRQKHGDGALQADDALAGGQDREHSFWSQITDALDRMIAEQLDPIQA